MAGKNELKYGPGVDIETINMRDISPESVLKIYPYKAVRRDAKVNFIEPNATTIVLISQEECFEFDERLITNFRDPSEDGPLVPFINKHFEAFSITSVGQQQTVITSRSQYKSQYAQIASFQCLTDAYTYVGDSQPMFFTIGGPFDPEAYERGDQRMYLGSSYQPAASGLVEQQLSGEEFSKDVVGQMSEFTLDDISTLEEQVDGAKIVFTFNPNLGKDIIVEDSGGEETEDTIGITFNMENRAWLGNTFIEAKGTREILSETETDDNGNPVVLDSSFGNIDFSTPAKLIPWQASPQSVDGKTVFNASWFNFTDVMPLYVVNAFQGGKTLEEARESYSSTKQIKGDSDDTMQLSQTISFSEDTSNFKFQRLYATSSPGGGFFVDGWTISLNKREDSDILWGIFSTRGYGDTDSSFTATFDPSTNILKFSNPSNAFSDIKQSDLSFFYVNDYESLFTQEDRQLIEDMLIISAGFADNWANAPIDSTTGLIAADYRVGHRGIKVQTVSRLESANVVISGLWATHEKMNPNLKNDPRRYKTLRSIINALSEDISSAYSTQGGGGKYHQMTLPWFLEPTGVINYRENLQTINDPLTGEEVESWVLPGVVYEIKSSAGGVDIREETKPSTVTFRVKTQYIKDTPMSSENVAKIYNGFQSPDLIPLSDIPSMQTDRVSFLPKIPESLTPLDKPTFPADYRGDLEKELGYLWYLLPNIDFYNIYVDNPEVSRDIAAGDTIDVVIPDTPYGQVWTDETIRNYIAVNYPKFEITSPIDISEKQSNTYKIEKSGRVSTSSAYVNVNIWKDIDKNLANEESLDFPFPFANKQAIRQWWYYKNDNVSPGFPLLEEQFSGQKVSVAHLVLCELLGIEYPKNVTEANSTHPIIPVTESYKDQAFGKGAWEGFKSFVSFGTRQEGTADYTYKLRASSVAPLTLRATEDIEGFVFKFEGQEVAYDENNWENLLIGQGVLPTQKTRINLVTDQSFTVKDIQELTITTTFTDNFEILPANGPAIPIKLPFRDNEAVTRHKVIFY